MKLLKWLSVSDRFAKAYLDSRLAPLGINSSQHMYLLKVCKFPGILQDSLLETFYVHPSNIVRTISALEKKGFLKREPYEQDKRTWRLYPTQKAMEIVEMVQTSVSETEKMILDSLTKEEQEIFGEMLYKMGKHLAEELHIERKEDEFDE